MASHSTKLGPPTMPSSMCADGAHTTCQSAKARCKCRCHGGVQLPPPVDRNRRLPEVEPEREPAPDNVVQINRPPKTAPKPKAPPRRAARRPSETSLHARILRELEHGPAVDPAGRALGALAARLGPDTNHKVLSVTLYRLEQAGLVDRTKSNARMVTEIRLARRPGTTPATANTPAPRPAEPATTPAAAQVPTPAPLKVVPETQPATPGTIAPQPLLDELEQHALRSVTGLREALRALRPPGKSHPAEFHEWLEQLEAIEDRILAVAARRLLTKGQP